MRRAKSCTEGGNENIGANSVGEVGRDVGYREASKGRGEQGNEENMRKLSRIKRQILNWGGFAGGNNQGTTIEQEARCGELIEQNLMNTDRE